MTMALLCTVLAFLAPSSCAPAVDPSALGSRAATADYEPAKSPAELASRSDVVVRGRVRRFVQRGEIRFGHDPDVPMRVIVMEVDVTDTLMGRSTNQVHLQTFGLATAAQHARAIPAGAEVQLFLRREPNDVYQYPGRFTENPDYPYARSQLYGLANPEAILVADPLDNAVVLPELGTQIEDATLEDFDPRLVTPFPQHRPPGNPEVHVTPAVAHPGDRLELSIVNETGRKVSYGLAARAQRRSGPRWLPANRAVYGQRNPGFRLIRLFALPGGRMVPPDYDDSIRLPNTIAPGRYRLLRRVQVGPRQTTMRFEFRVRR